MPDIQYRTWLGLVVMTGVAVIYLSCQDRPEIRADALTGRWRIAMAERNGKRSEYLDRGYFTFEKGGRMTVNLTGAEEAGAFTIDERTLQMDGHRDYLIEKQAQDTLFIRFRINPESEFRAILIRDEESAK